MNLRLLAFLLIVLALGLAMYLMVSSGPDPQAVPTASQVSQRTMSPYCEGLLVSDCPSADSARLRSRIAEKVEAGWTNRQIDSWLVANYGQQILGRPSQVASWLVPLSAIAAGLGGAHLHPVEVVEKSDPRDRTRRDPRGAGEDQR